MEENVLDKDTLDRTILYFQNIISNNITNYSRHKIGATFIGIKTNISGTLKLHIYILLFPFIHNENTIPYSNRFPNLYFKDICLDVSESFYVWIYEEMKKQKNMVILSFESNIFKVVPGTGDVLIQTQINNNEIPEWMDLEYEAWYEKKSWNTTFIIQIINPFLYMVPFPVKPIILKTVKNYNNNYIQMI